MLAVISKAFGFSSSVEPAKLKPRQINLSGEIVSFSLPENFSKDMPAENMIESVDLSDKSVFTDYHKFTLIRRWWDFKSKGFFSKEYGSIMMSIYVRQAPENSEYEISNPLGFIGTIIHNYNEVSSKENPSNKNEKPTTLYPDFYEAYTIKTINSLQWFRYPVESSLSGRYDVNYAIPITPQHYIIVEFLLAPNDDISTRQFLNEYGQPHMDSIMNTFDVKFSGKSKLPSIYSQPIDLEKLISDKFYSEDKTKSNN